MSAASDLAASIQALVAGVAAAADDTGDRIRLLIALAGTETPKGGDEALAAVGRRAALAALARACAAHSPASYDEAEALRMMVCGMLANEETIAADAGQDGVVTALRAVRDAVDRDLRRRGADLSPLRTVDPPAPVAGVVLAHRLYGDAEREGEVLAAYEATPNPVFLIGAARVLAR